jgi:dolichol-phosphate mannosyltransferase
MSTERKIRLVIPAYDEAPNVPRLMADLAPHVRELNAQVIVVDDGSTDGTADVVRAHAGDLDLRVISHRVNSGMGAAVDTGLRAALADAADDDAIVTVEADTTSNLDDLKKMVAQFDRGYDLVLASVYAPGGEIRGVSGHRVALSRAVSNVFRFMCGLRDLHTLSSLYRVYRAGTLRRVAERHGSQLVTEHGFAVNIELLLKFHEAGARVTEVPTINDWTNRMGESKMRTLPTALAYGRVMAGHLGRRLRPAPAPALTEAGREA